jgi:hypothetical protein
MLTKDLVGKLSPEQQEIFAQMEFRKTQQRLKLLEVARGNDWRSRWFPLYLFAVFLGFLALYYFNCFHVQGKPAVLLVPFGVVIIFALCAFIGRTNRRLDALLELMDFDREHPKDEKNG